MRVAIDIKATLVDLYGSAIKDVSDEQLQTLSQRLAGLLAAVPATSLMPGRCWHLAGVEATATRRESS